MITKIYIDENFASQIADGLNVFQKHLNLKEKHQFEVLSIKNAFRKGIKDEEWIPIVGKEKAIIITQDLRIQTTRHQRDLYHKYDLGIFFFKPPSKQGYTFWQMVELLIKHWERIKSLTIKSKRPFAFKCSNRSSSFEELN